MSEQNIHRIHVVANAPIRTINAVLATTKAFATPAVSIRRENLAVETCALISIMLVPLSPIADVEIVDILLAPQKFVGDKKNEKKEDSV